MHDQNLRIGRRFIGAEMDFGIRNSNQSLELRLANRKPLSYMDCAPIDKYVQTSLVRYSLRWMS